MSSTYCRVRFEKIYKEFVRSECNPHISGSHEEFTEVEQILTEIKEIRGKKEIQKKKL